MKKIFFLLALTIFVSAIHAQTGTGKTKNEKENKVMIPHGQTGHVCDESCPMNPNYKKNEKVMIPHGQTGHVCDESCPMNPNYKKNEKAMIPHGQTGHVCDKTCPMNSKYKKPKRKRRE